MRTDWRAAAGLLLIVGAILGTVLIISFARASGGNEATRYEVNVRFNTSVTQDDIEEASALLRAYDGAMEFVVMESFPPIGRAVMGVESSGFCRTVEAELEAKSYVRDVSCQPLTVDGSADPGAPVSTDNGTG